MPFSYRYSFVLQRRIDVAFLEDLSYIFPFNYISLGGLYQMRRLVILLFVLSYGCGTQSEDAKNAASRPLTNQSRPGTASWTAPAGWVTESPSSNFRKAQYRLPRVDQDPEDASCIVFHFQGGGGGVEANLQRWYGQFTQPDGRPSNEVATVKRSSVNGLRQTRSPRATLVSHGFARGIFRIPGVLS